MSDFGSDREIQSIRAKESKIEIKVGYWWTREGNWTFGPNFPLASTSMVEAYSSTRFK